MKKILSMLLAFALSLICFVGCGGDEPLLQGGGSTDSETEKIYTITYVLTDDLGTMKGEAVQEVKFGESFTLNTLSREGEYIGYWTYNGEKFEEDIWNLDTNITLYSKWIDSKYTITYLLTDEIGTMEGETVQEVVYGESFTLNKLSGNQGFVGCWMYNDEVFKEGIWTLEENITLQSKWVQAKYEITYELTDNFGHMEGEIVQEVKFGEEFKLNRLLAHNIDYIGYWTHNGEKFEEGVWKLEENITLQSKWVYTMYTITYVLTDGLGAMQGEVVQQVKLGEAFTLNKLSRDEEYTGYWTYNGKEFKEGVWNLEENITLYSAWTPNWTGIY